MSQRQNKQSNSEIGRGSEYRHVLFYVLTLQCFLLVIFTNRRSVEILCYQIMVNILSNNVFLIKACHFFIHNAIAHLTYYSAV